MQMTRKIHPNQDKTIIITRTPGQDVGPGVERILNEFIRAVATLLATNGYTNEGDVKNATNFLALNDKHVSDGLVVNFTEAIPMTMINEAAEAFAELALMEYIVRDEIVEGKPIRGSMTLTYTVDQEGSKVSKKVRVVGVFPIFLLQAIRDLYLQLKEVVIVVTPSVGSMGKNVSKEPPKNTPPSAKPATAQRQQLIDPVGDGESMELFKKLDPKTQQLVCDLMIQFMSKAVIQLNDKLMSAIANSKK